MNSLNRDQWKEHYCGWKTVKGKKINQYDFSKREIKELLEKVRQEAEERGREEARSEVLEVFDEMVTLHPKSHERSDILMFRTWLRMSDTPQKTLSKLKK